MSTNADAVTSDNIRRLAGDMLTPPSYKLFLEFTSGRHTVADIQRWAGRRGRLTVRDYRMALHLSISYLKAVAQEHPGEDEPEGGTA